MSTPITPTRRVLLGMVSDLPNWSNVTPFTYQDGLTNAKLMESIIKWIDESLVPYVDEGIKDQITKWTTALTEIVAQLENSMDEFDNKVSEQLAENLKSVTNAINDVINSSVKVQTSVVLGMLNDPENPVRVKGDSLYAGKSIEQTVATHTSDIATIESELATKADSTSVDELNTVVSGHSVDISEIENTLTRHENDIANKADKSDILPVPPTVTKPIIATHFLTSHEAVYVAISSDGETFEETNVFWKPEDNAELGEAWARDPSIVYYGGFYYIAYTRVGSKLGGAFGRTNSIGLVRVSADFKTWTPLDPVIMPGNPVHTWAPEWFVGEDGLPRIIFAMRNSPTDLFKQYLITPSNPGLTAWGAPVEMVGLTGNIDATVLKIGSVFHAFTANQQESRMKHYAANSITGPYSVLATSEINTGAFTHLEGPSIVRLNNGGWRMYLDAYNEVDCAYYTDSFDLTHWTPIRAVTLPMRHIGTVQVDAIPLREYPPVRPNLNVTKGAAAPYWGARRQPSDINKDWMQIMSINTGNGWAPVIPASQLGFSGVDYLSAEVVHSDSVDVCVARIQIWTDNIVAISLWDYAGAPMLNKTAKVAVRIVGWGSAADR